MGAMNITCIICPLSCEITTVSKDGKVLSMAGFQCTRGEEYAFIECTEPKRMLASTVLVRNGRFPVAAVRTTHAIPKEKMFDCIKEISKIAVEAPCMVGQIVVNNIIDTGADIIITRPDPGILE